MMHLLSPMFHADEGHKLGSADNVKQSPCRKMPMRSSFQVVKTPHLDGSPVGDIESSEGLLRPQ